MDDYIPDLNLFMMCEKLNESALSEMPSGYLIRTCRRDEFELWKRIHFDDPVQGEEYSGFMDQYFADTYASSGDLFFKKCLFVCDDNDTPVATCFSWKSYGKINTIHWFKVIRSFEGRGIGRALLSIVMRELKEDDYPVFLHTQPSSYRAIKLYSDFGFALLSDEVIGYRENGLQQSLPILKAHMPEEEYSKLKISPSPEFFLSAVLTSNSNQF